LFFAGSLEVKNWLKEGLGQPLRKPSDPDDARGLTNFGTVISWTKSFNASISKGLRSIFKLAGAPFAASLYPVVRAIGKFG